MKYVSFKLEMLCVPDCSFRDVFTFESYLTRCYVNILKGFPVGVCSPKLFLFLNMTPSLSEGHQLSPTVPAAGLCNLAPGDFCSTFSCSAGPLQCWNSLQLMLFYYGVRFSWF